MDHVERNILAEDSTVVFALAAARPASPRRRASSFARRVFARRSPSIGDEAGVDQRLQPRSRKALRRAGRENDPIVRPPLPPPLGNDNAPLTSPRASATTRARRGGFLARAAKPAGQARRRWSLKLGLSPGDGNRQARGASQRHAPVCCRSSRRRFSRRRIDRRAARNPPSIPACPSNGYARHAIAARRRWPWR